MDISRVAMTICLLAIPVLVCELLWTVGLAAWHDIVGER